MAVFFSWPFSPTDWPVPLLRGQVKSRHLGEAWFVHTGAHLLANHGESLDCHSPRCKSAVLYIIIRPPSVTWQSQWSLHSLHRCLTVFLFSTFNMLAGMKVTFQWQRLNLGLTIWGSTPRLQLFSELLFKVWDPVTLSCRGWPRTHFLCGPRLPWPPYEIKGMHSYPQWWPGTFHSSSASQAFGVTGMSTQAQRARLNYWHYTQGVCHTFTLGQLRNTVSF